MFLYFATWLQGTGFSVTIQSVSWIIPLLQSIHILMIGIVFVSILMVSLRILGRARMDEPFTLVWQRFAPWLWTAVVVMALSGLLLVAGEPVRQFASTSFWLKMFLLALGIGSILAFRKSLDPVLAADTNNFSPLVRYSAVASLLLWLAIIFLGRAIAYDVEVWGSLSLSLA